MIVGRARGLLEVDVSEPRYRSQEWRRQDSACGWILVGRRKVRSEWNGIQVPLPSQVPGQRTNISHIQDCAESNILLHAGAEVHCHRHITYKICPPNILGEEVGRSALKLRDFAIEQCRSLDQRGLTRQSSIVRDHKRVVKNSAAGADSGLACPKDVPCEAEPRRPLDSLVLVHAALDTGIQRR